MKRSGISLLLIVIFLLHACSTPRTTTVRMDEKQQAAKSIANDTLIETIMRRQPEPFEKILSAPSEYRVQIIYTEINRGGNVAPQLTHHYYNHQPELYFYPASTVKMPVAALALQRLNESKMAGLTKSATMVTGAASPGQTAVYNDPSTTDGRPTIEQYIKKIFLVSDNDAYNRLYEFLGQEYINNSLHRMGYDSAQILHRLQIALTEEQNRTTNPVVFYDTAGAKIYNKPLLRSGHTYQPRQTFLGQGYMAGGKRIDKPFDFSQKNLLRLADLHSMLQSIVLPGTVPTSQRFNLTASDYACLRTYMSMKPSESSSPVYDSFYTDAYGKFLLFGGKGSMANPSLRIFNKIGDAYGFLQDVAYVVDFDKGIEFMLSATIYCNSDGIFNDDNYDYDTIGFPFLKALGQAIYNYESSRPRNTKPDLSAYKFTYTD